MHIHSGNVEQFWGRRVRVWLDGTEMNADWIEECNEEGGYLVMYIPSKDGDPFVDPKDEIRKVKLLGRVDVTLDGEELSPEKMLECGNLFRVRRASA